MEEFTRQRHQWMADHILVWEPAVRHWLCRYARTLTRDDIDDLLQEAYARLWKVDFSLVRSGRKLLFTTVANVLKDQLRRARVVSIESVAEFEPLGEEAPGPEHRVSAQQRFERLLEAVKKLTPQQRAVFQASKFEGLNGEQIALRMGISKKTVENHMRFALAEVTRIMFGEGEIARQTSHRDDRERAPKRD